MRRDYSPNMFDAASTFRGVRMQQGRVQLDDDRNEEAAGAAAGKSSAFQGKMKVMEQLASLCAVLLLLSCFLHHRK